MEEKVADPATEGFLIVFVIDDLQHRLSVTRPRSEEKAQTLVMAVTPRRGASAFLHVRGVRFSVALEEEAHALLVRPVRVEARHHHDLPRQVSDEARRAEHRLAQAAEAFHHEAEGRLGPPAGVWKAEQPRRV